MTEEMRSPEGMEAVEDLTERDASSIRQSRARSYSWSRGLSFEYRKRISKAGSSSLQRSSRQKIRVYLFCFILSKR